MNLLLVTFSLRNPNRDYSQFFVALRGNALQWWHFIEQTAIVFTHLDVQGYTNVLLPHMENTDSVLVVKVSPHQFQGWLPKEAWNWLNGVSDQISQPLLPSVLPRLPRG
jgi:hypothetical protein